MAKKGPLLIADGSVQEYDSFKSQVTMHNMVNGWM